MLLLLPLRAWGQGPGARAGALLDVPATSRAAALGAFGAVFGDEGSVFVNPAGLAPIRHIALGVSAESGLRGARLGSAAGALRVGRFTLGGGAMYLDHTGDSVLVPDPAFGGGTGVASGPQVTAYNMLGVGAIAYRRGMFSFGVSAKGLREYISDGSPNTYVVHGVTGNAGLGLAFFDIAAFGFVIENIGGTLRGQGRRFSLPRTTRGGFTLNFLDPQGAARLMTTVDWVRPPSGNAYWALATEMGVVQSGFGLIGRAGVTTGGGNVDRQDTSYGAGLQLRSVRLDYASLGYRGAARRTHRFGMRWVL